MRRSRCLTLAAVLACALLGGSMAKPSWASEPGTYWSWGWGLYGLRVQNDPLDNARFDWSYVLFGNVDAPDHATIDRANEVLRLNPKHRFVIRVWPILHLGDCPENNGQATLFHYVYQPEVRAKILAETRRQIQFVLENISHPLNVVGATFLEELPLHFTSAPFGPEWTKWRTGDRLPWDVARFEKQIASELGEPFDLRNPRHVKWWGRKYVEVLTQINREMKKELGDRKVFYYPHPHYRSLDALPAVAQRKSSHADLDRVPFRYKELVRPGVADGIFGYPSRSDIWDGQTKTVSALRCLLFSQISVPAAMRLTSLQDATRMALWSYPGNLGAFLFPSIDQPSRERGYSDQEYQTSTEIVRRFAWDNHINLDIVDHALTPTIELDYDLTRVASDGTSRVQALLWNRRHPSWYGGSFERASLPMVQLTLLAPVGFQIVGGENAATVEIGDVGPQSGRAASWRVRQVDLRPGVAQAFRVEVAAATSSGVVTAVVSEARDKRAPILQSHLIARSGQRWAEAAYRLPSFVPAAELVPLDQDIDSPMLARTGAGRVFYKGVLRATTRLVIGPGAHARLFPAELFDAETRRFAPHPPGLDGTVEFREGYSVYAAQGPEVRSGEKLRFQVRGRAVGGGNCRVDARFVGMQNGIPTTMEVTVLLNAFSDELRSIESQEVEVPTFDGDKARVALRFYRFPTTGALYLQSVNGHRSDLPERGIDVSDRVVGELPLLDAPFTSWTYYDRSRPELGERPKVSVRFLGIERKGNAFDRPDGGETAW